jgi:hypothetical protein
MFGKSFVASLTDFFCSPAFYAKVATFCLLSSALLVRGRGMGGAMSCGKTWRKTPQLVCHCDSNPQILVVVFFKIPLPIYEQNAYFITFAKKIGFRDLNTAWCFSY